MLLKSRFKYSPCVQCSCAVQVPYICHVIHTVVPGTRYIGCCSLHSTARPAAVLQSVLTPDADLHKNVPVLGVQVLDVLSYINYVPNSRACSSGILILNTEITEYCTVFYYCRKSSFLGRNTILY